MKIEECLEKSRFESQGSIVLAGQTIPYHTVSEDNFLSTRKANRPLRSFPTPISAADVADASTRPVLFAYNGGPGCSSLWVPPVCSVRGALNWKTSRICRPFRRLSWKTIRTACWICAISFWSIR